MPHWPSGPEVIQKIKEMSAEPVTILAFSSGKDSLAAYLALRPHFERIIPVYKYSVPNLEFIEEGLRYYEHKMGTPIERIPHDSLYRMLNNYVFQPPGRWEILMDHRLPRLDRQKCHEPIIQQLGLHKGTWTALGTRRDDSPARRMNFITHGPINFKARTYSPVWDMTKGQLVTLIRKSGWKLPMEYRIFGRSFDGLDFRFLFGIRRYFPRDYRKILDWFPLAELEIKRYEYAKKRQARKEV
jgi:hypothetical protein